MKQALILIGGPASGKSRMAEKLAMGGKFQMVEMSKHVLGWAHDNPLKVDPRNPKVGEEIRSLMDKGDLVPDRLVNPAFHMYMRSGDVDLQASLVLPGFVRSVSQAIFVPRFLESKGYSVIVVNFKLSNEKCVERNNFRVVNDGSKRKDDAPEVFLDRLKIYNENMSNVLEAFKDKKIVVHDLDANLGVDDVFQKFCKIIISTDRRDPHKLSHSSFETQSV